MVAGIDIGSLTTNAVVLNDRGEMTSEVIISTGFNGRKSGEKALSLALVRADINRNQLSRVVATGYGRINAPYADKTVTEISCHARGAVHLFPGTRTIIDIGGQDAKVIRVGMHGTVSDFAMNDKCAAGTGRFLEVMARALEIPLEDMGAFSLKSGQKLSISSICTVFAESEVIAMIARETPREDILCAIHDSSCNRVWSMAKRLGVEKELTLSGGVAKNSAIVHNLAEKAGFNINVPKEPQIVGALGAALIAKDMADS